MSTLLVVAGLITIEAADAAEEGERLAFSGAEGFGCFATGEGRGGEFYQVTTLADSGAGSLPTCNRWERAAK